MMSFMVETVERILAYTLSCVVETIIIFDFYNNLFHSKERKKIILYLYQICFILIWICINLLNIPFLNFMYFTIGSLLSAYLFYNIQQPKNFFQIIVLLISFSACDALMSLLFSIFTKNALPYYRVESHIFLFNVIAVEATLFAMSRILILFLKARGATILHRRQLVFLSLFPIMNIFIFYIISFLYKCNWNSLISNYAIFLIMIITTLLNLAIIMFFEYISKTNELETNIILIRQQMDMQYQYYKQLEMNHDQNQRLLHDLKNHLQVINDLYKTDSHAGKEYSKNIRSLIETYSMKFKCDNRLLNIIVNEKIQICERSNIKFICSVENFDLSFLSDIEITSLFANLLDNAIEACKKITIGKKYIDFRLYSFNKTLVINIANSVATLPKMQDGNYVSSKQGHKAIGLSNVEQIIEKHSGDLSIQAEPNIFTIDIFLPIQT